MTETAKRLEAAAEDGGKVIVLTGSMTPACFRETDAEFNLGLAIGALQSNAPGVYMGVSGRVFQSGAVRKNREAGCFRRL